MIDGLAAVCAVVDDHAITLGEAFGTGNFGHGTQQMAKQRLVAFIAIGQRRDVFPRGQQHMHGRLRVDVGKGVAQLVLVNGGGGDASFNDLAEEATHGETSVQELVSTGAETAHAPASI